MLDRTALGLADAAACTAPGLTGLDSCKSDEEMDIEASFALGSRVYVAGSHSNNKSGKSRTDRWRLAAMDVTDRKSTRLNSSHLVISYAVFCLKKKKKKQQQKMIRQLCQAPCTEHITTSDHSVRRHPCC